MLIKQAETDHSYTADENMLNDTDALKTAWQLLVKLNMQLPHNQATVLQGIYPREIKSSIHTKTFT